MTPRSIFDLPSIAQKIFYRYGDGNKVMSTARYSAIKFSMRMTNCIQYIVNQFRSFIATTLASIIAQSETSLPASFCTFFTMLHRLESL